MLCKMCARQAQPDALLCTIHQAEASLLLSRVMPLSFDEESRLESFRIGAMCMTLALAAVFALVALIKSGALAQ